MRDDLTDSEFDARLREAITGEPIDISGLERSILARTRRGNRTRHAAGAVAVAVALVALAIPLLRRSDMPAAYRQAARDHRLEVVEHRLRHWSSTPDQIDALEVSYGITAGGARKMSPRGYRLEHARTCRLEGKPVLHLVYTDGAHEFSVYIIQTPGGETEIEGQHVRTFQTKNVAGLVVGSVSECAKFASAL